MHERKKDGLIRDLGIVALSILLAINLEMSGAFERILAHTGGILFLESFVAGIFFTSVFTTAPAIVAFFEISKGTPLWEVALIGGLGAMVGDLLIFRFVRDRIAEDVTDLITGRKGRWIKILRLKSFRWVAALIGGLVIASPLPDELGITLLGFSRVKTKYFLPISFVFNSIGILVIGLLAKVY